jgi:hypothetical protein
MDWLTLLSGLGLGVLGAKALDVFILQDMVRRHQHEQWLRDRRLEAFSTVTKELISFGLHGGKERSPFESYAAISQALLLIDDDKLTERIDQFIVDLYRMNTLTDKDEKKDIDVKEANDIYVSLVKEARDIAQQLRSLVLHDKVPS